MPNKNYDKEHLRQVLLLNQRIKKIFHDSIVNLSFQVKSVRYNGRLFNLKDYPQLDKQIKKMLTSMHQKIFGAIVNGIEASWNLSNVKNDVLIDTRLAGKIPTDKAKSVLYDPNKKALTKYLERSKNGLNISDRVWKSVNPFRNELEQAIGFSIKEGTSAIETAVQIKKYLNEPDRLFRRVRSEEGKLTLSQAARNYHPGSGTYRSSYKNALRLARTEKNIAYRLADYERWQKMPFVTGVSISLSNNHPVYDICDLLVGDYPKDFLWTGWHPSCLCTIVPKQLSREEYNKIEKQILAGEEINIPDQLKVLTPPAGFDEWVIKNKERIDHWKSKPYWYQDNKQFIE